MHKNYLISLSQSVILSLFYFSKLSLEITEWDNMLDTCEQIDVIKYTQFTCINYFLNAFSYIIFKDKNLKSS